MEGGATLGFLVIHVVLFCEQHRTTAEHSLTFPTELQAVILCLRNVFIFWGKIGLGLNTTIILQLIKTKHAGHKIV